MKKTFKLDEIDCANCALKLEEALRKVDGVQEVKVNFLSQKLTLAAADDAFDAVLKQVVKTARKVEPDCRDYPVKHAGRRAAPHKVFF